VIEAAILKFETRVSDIIARTYNAKGFRFPRPDSFDYVAGQFMFVTIKNREQELTRPFSISSSPTEAGWIEFTKRLTEYPFSLALTRLRIGDWAMIDGPYGNFTLDYRLDKVGMLAGGIGITPMRSICKYCTDTESQVKITLFYGNRTEEDIVFRDELEKMEEKNTNIEVIFVIDRASRNWTGYLGKIDAEMIRKEIPDYAKTFFYTCGPPAMVDAMEKLLKELSIPAAQIRKENFIGY
jgi:ferredoxin-NADP reductase